MSDRGGALVKIADLVAESNRIEGIYREPSAAEIAEHRRFMQLSAVTVEELQNFVKVYQPNAVLRDRPGLNVRVGSYYPPPGGPEIRERLEKLLKLVDSHTPWQIHIAYETLHPFTDGNGRSGRMLWYWCMQELNPQLIFLHRFYYQTLQSVGR